MTLSPATNEGLPPVAQEAAPLVPKGDSRCCRLTGAAQWQFVASTVPPGFCHEPKQSGLDIDIITIRCDSHPPPPLSATERY